MKYTPVLVGALVGAGDGAISQSTSLSTHKYAHGIYKFGVLGLGAAGEMFFGWNPNISYGMMTAAATLIGARVPAAFVSGNGGIKALATYSVDRNRAHPTAAGMLREYPGDENRAHATAAGMLQEYPGDDNRAHPTAAGKVAGCSACGQMAAAKRAAHAHVMPMAGAYPVGNTDYHAREQHFTEAG